MIKIANTNFNTYNKRYTRINKEENKRTLTEIKNTNSIQLRAQFNDHLISFGARVDKGLDRFYETNKDRMPTTVRRYIESLEDKSKLTPLEAQQRAFYKLQNANNLSDIKTEFPDEELFQNLKTPIQTGAKRGILQIIKDYAELFEMCDEGILKNKEDITVYLLKKVFLEAKSIEEINKDLENDLSEDFKGIFKTQQADSNTPYVYGTTLKALGIQLPTFEYQQSLRYTKEGYSDKVGANISKARIAFIESLTPEQRMSLSKKSIENFENWWATLSKEEILEMIEKKETEIELLNKFKSFEKIKKEKNNSTKQTTRAHAKKSTTKIDTPKYAKDELFIKWATTNLKLFEASLTDDEKNALEKKRVEKLALRWQEMTPVEKTNFIERLKTLSEPTKYVMTDAWNHSTGLIKDLYLFLKEKQVHRPAEVIFATQAFSQFQSQIMNEFWETHVNYATSLGERIIESQAKINKAIQEGSYEYLKKQIDREKTLRIKEIEKFKNESSKLSSELPTTEESDLAYKVEFKKAYNENIWGKIKSLPTNYYNDLYETALAELPETVIKAWTKNLKGIKISEEENKILLQYLSQESKYMARINRVLEAALADTLYDCIKNPVVYELSNSDVKTVLYHIEKGSPQIAIYSKKNNQNYQFNLVKSKVNPARINQLYEHYKTNSKALALCKIITQYFSVEDFKTEKQIYDYLDTYGQSLDIIFAKQSTYPKSVKKAFYNKLKRNMPKELAYKLYNKCLLDKQDAFEIEEKLKTFSYAYQNRFSFVPTEYMNIYTDMLTHHLRLNQNTSPESIENLINTACIKRKSIKGNHKILMFDSKTKPVLMIDRLKLLVIEKALADILYDATNDINVYGLQFEELIDNIEIFNLATKFPTEKRSYYSKSLNKDICLQAQRKLNLRQINSLTKEYNDLIENCYKEHVEKGADLDSTELLYCLNPEDNMPELDIIIKKKLEASGFTD